MISLDCWLLPERAEQAPQGSGRRRPSFSLPRLGRGVHRPAAAALRSGAGEGVQAWLSSRGCGSRAFARVDEEEEGPKLPRAAARPAGHTGLNLAVLLISFQGHQRMALLWADPLPRNDLTPCSVRLYW